MTTPNQSYIGATIPSAFSPLTNNAKWYLERVGTAKPEEAFTWQILAMRSYLAAEQLQPALALFDHLQSKAIEPDQKAQLQLMQAHLLLAKGERNQALILLEAKPQTALDGQTQINWYRQRVLLQLEINNTFGAAKSLIALDPYLTPADQSINRQQIWTLLKKMTPSTLQALEENGAPDVTTGWLRLAALVNEFGAQPSKMARQLAIWQREFPNHPAQHNLPAGLNKLAAMTDTMVTQVAVLLPLSGNLEPQGSAIRNGMLTSYKENQRQFTLAFYDTQSGSISELYQRALQGGADMIIGPLLKEQVTELINLGPTIPVLALNELDTPLFNEKVYYFSLSAAADAAQAAHYLYAQQYRNPLLIAAQGRIGDAGVAAFEGQWASLTQSKPLVARFSARNEIAGMVKNALTDSRRPRSGEIVSLSESETRAIDAVYLIANPLETRMIKPYVDISVTPMGSLPIYTGPRGYDVTAPKATSELNNLRIAEMPIMLAAHQQQRELFTALWPQLQGELLRLFAMGYDAVSLVEMLPQMRKNGDLQHAGMSGTLTIAPQGNVIRTLNWGRYQDGRLIDDSAQEQGPAAADVVVEPYQSEVDATLALINNPQ